MSSDVGGGAGGHVVRGRLVTPGRLLDDGVVTTAGDRVTFLGTAEEYAAARAARSADPVGPPPLPEPAEGWVLPGLVDLHNHGGGGASYNEGRPDQNALASAEHLRHGSTSVLATLVTERPGAMLGSVAAAADSADRGEVAGVYVEGPFLSPARCGAQHPTDLRDPDAGLARELVGAGRGHLRVVTLAPELPGADRVVSVLLEHGVVPAVGHTDADASRVRTTLATARAALGRPGIVSHLFNAMPPLHHRAPGPVAGALTAAAAGDTVVELVADGVHLADETVQMVFELLGPHRIALVTDAMSAAGMPDGTYRLGHQAVTVRESVARLGDGVDAPLAGGTSHLLDVVRRCTHAGVRLVDAVTAATRTPAEALGLHPSTAALEPGSPADLVVVDADLEPLHVMRRGRWVT